MISITPILAATQSPDVAARVAAEDALKNAEASDAGAYAKALVDELACASAPLATRQLAGVILKNTLDAKDEAGWSALQRAAEAGQAVEQDGPTRTYPRMYGCRTDSAWPWHHCDLLRAGGS